MKIFLHIGPAKTGTTTIQLALNKFENEKYYYADFEEFEEKLRFGNGNHSTPLKFLFEDKFFYSKCEILKISKTEGNKIRKELETHLEQMIERKMNKSIIFSGEGLGFMNGRSTKNLKTKFEEMGCSLKLIYYYRDPLERTKSQVQQKNKDHHFTLSDYSYKSVMQNLRFYVKHFDKEQILVRSFNKNDMLNGSVVDDFCSIFDIDIGDIKVDYANESMTEDAFKVLYYRSKMLVNNGAKVGKEFGKDKMHRKIKNLYSSSKKKLNSNHFKIATSVEKIDEINFLKENTVFSNFNGGEKTSTFINSLQTALNSFLILLKIRVDIKTQDEFDEYFSDISRIDHSNLDALLEESGLDINFIKKMHFDDKLLKLDQILYP